MHIKTSMYHSIDNVYDKGVPQQFVLENNIDIVCFKELTRIRYNCHY